MQEDNTKYTSSEPSYLDRKSSWRVATIHFFIAHRLLFLISGIIALLIGFILAVTIIGIKTSTNDFFFFSIPKPIESLVITDLPSDGNLTSNVISINDSLWFTAGGSIIEYNIKSAALVSYSNKKRANCDNGLVYVAGYLFASCRIDNVDDAFGRTSQLQTELYTGHYGVLKINLQTHKLERIFSKEDGLLNGYNYRLFVDGDTIWIATFNGVGRINAKTNNVDFYADELGFQNSSNAVNYNITDIIIDKDYIWAWNPSSAESQGGITLFNKALGTWKAFGPRELKDYSFNWIYLENRAMKLIPGGIQIAFRDGSLETAYEYKIDRLVEKQYNYQSEKWTKVNGDRPASGPNSEQTRQYIASAYPSNFNYAKVDQFGLTQLQIPDSNQVYQLDGRSNYVLSPMVGNKRYILTSATVDVIDNSSSFRQIVLKLGERLVGVPTNQPLQFLIDPDTSFAMIIDRSWVGIGTFTDDQKAFLLDLKTGKINKIYTIKDGLPNGALLGELSMSKRGNLLIIKDKNLEELLNIDITNYELTVLNK